MPTLLLRSLVVLGAAVLASGALACAGAGTGSISRPAVPAAAAPRNVIAFGAQAGDGAFGLYLVRPNGSALRKLSDEDAAVAEPRWSPAGDRIAYASGGALRLYDFSSGAASTVSGRLLPGELGPPMSWSPDGERLAFIEDAGGGRLRIYDVAHDKLLDVVDLPALAVEWFPTADRLAVVRAGESPRQTAIDTVQPDGSGAKQIVAGPGLNGGPSWSPDGRLLASWSAPSAGLAARTLALRSPEGDQQSDLGAGLDPAWSADGQLAYSRPSSAAAGAAFDIYLLTSTGEEPRPLARATTLDRWPSWSPDGTTVAYLAQADRSTAFVCTIVIETQDQSCLDLGGLLPTQPAWSPF